MDALRPSLKASRARRHRKDRLINVMVLFLALAAFCLSITEAFAATNLIASSTPSSTTITSQYEILESALRLSDQAATVRVSAYQTQGSKALLTLTYGDIWTDVDFARALQVQPYVDTSTANATLQVSANIRERTPLEIEAFTGDSRWNSMSIAAELAEANSVAESTYRPFEIATFIVEVTYKNESLAYPAVALWLDEAESPDQVFLQIVDPLTNQVPSLENLLQLHLSRAEQLNGATLEDTTKSDSQLVCEPTEESFQFGSPIPNGLWQFNGKVVNGLHQYTETQGHTPLTFTGPSMHFFSVRPTLTCKCTNTCYNSGFLTIEPVLSYEDYDSQIDIHNTDAAIAVDETLPAPLLDEQSWAYGGSAVHKYECNFISALACWSSRNGTTLAELTVSGGEEISELNLKGGLKVTGGGPGQKIPLKGVFGGLCPPCKRWLTAGGEIHGLPDGEQIEVWVQWEGPDGQYVEPVLVKQAVGTVVSEDVPIKWQLSDYPIPQARYNGNREFKIYALNPTGGLNQTCPAQSYFYNRTDIDADLHCECTDTDGNGALSELEKSSCGGSDVVATAAIAFTNFDTQNLSGEVRATFLETKSDGSTAVHQALVNAETGTAEYETQPTVGSEWSDFELSSVLGGWNCHEFTPGGDIRGPFTTRGSCTRQGPNICEVLPPVCEELPPDDDCYRTETTTVLRSVQCEDVWYGAKDDNGTPEDPSDDIIRMDILGEECDLNFTSFSASEEWCDDPFDSDDDGWPFGGYSSSPAKALAMTESGPTLYFRNLNGSTQTGDFWLAGVAHHPEKPVGRIELLIDGVPMQDTWVTLGALDTFVCQELPEVGCDEKLGFGEIIDSSLYGDGEHLITAVAHLADGSQSSMTSISLTFDNSGGDNGGGGGGGGGGDTQEGDHAEFIDSDFPTTMIAGSSRLVTVTAENMGTTTWTDEECYTLAMKGGSDPFTSINRHSLPNGEPVESRETARFYFTLTAPSTPGSYTTDWRMLAALSCGSNGWFGPRNVSMEMRHGHLRFSAQSDGAGFAG